MFKRFISIFLALCLSLSFFCVSVFADNNIIERNSAKYYASLFDLITQYKNNEISLDTLLSESFENYMDVGTDNISQSFVNLSDIINSIGNLGFDVSGDWFEWNYQKMGGDGSGGLRDDSILNGYGACAKLIDDSNPYHDAMAYYCDYILYEPEYDSPYSLKHITAYLDCDGNLVECSKTISHFGRFKYYNFYGDVRYSDGSYAEEGATELPEKEIPAYDDDSVSDDDLIDFLEDLLSDLMLQFPDLSTVEGLLRAILAKCTSIDEKMNQTGGGMDPDELSLLLDKSILSLTVQNKVNNDALLQELISIRETLQGYKDEEIPPDEANSILEGLISGITSGLLSFVGIDLEVSEIIDICEEAGDLGLSVLRGIVNIISILNAAVPLQAVNALITTLTGIIFNLNEPTDLSFTLNGTEVTFLSVDLLSVPQISGALSIIKGLVSILAAYAWLKWARKFYLSQF